MSVNLCECDLCSAAMLNFVWDYLLVVEHRSADDCFKMLQSQPRAMERARSLLRTLFTQLANGDVEGQRVTVLDAVNRCGFCQASVAKWNAI